MIFFVPLGLSKVCTIRESRDSNPGFSLVPAVGTVPVLSLCEISQTFGQPFCRRSYCSALTEHKDLSPGNGILPFSTFVNEFKEASLNSARL